MNNTKYKKGFSYIFTLIIILILTLLFTLGLTYMIVVSGILNSKNYVEEKLNDYIDIKSMEIYSYIKNGTLSYDKLSSYPYLESGTNIYDFFNIINGEIIINKTEKIGNISFSYSYNDKLVITCFYTVYISYPFSNLDYEYSHSLSVTSNYINKILL